MSAAESDDEFALNGPSTPNVPKRINATTTKTRGNSARAEAGPSRAGNTNASRKKGIIVATQEQSDDDEVQEVKRSSAGQNVRRKRKQPGPMEEEVVVLDEDDEENSTNGVEVIDPPPTVKGRAGSKKPASRAETGTGAIGQTKPHRTKVAVEITKNKGKQKAKAIPASKKQDPEPMDVDIEDVAVDDMNTDDEEREAAGSQERLAEAINKSGRSGGIKPEKWQGSSHSRKDAQIARLEKQLQQAQENIKDLQRQLDEFNQIRMTEPEQLMERMQYQHQAQIEVKENLLQDLKAELAKRDPLLKSGKKSVFELLTREEANHEMQELLRRLGNCQDVIKQQEEHLRLQEKEMQALQEDKRMLDIQLQEEVRRNKEFSVRPPPTSSKSRTGGIISPGQDPKMTQVVSFYEDLTNVIVPNMKSIPGRYFGIEEWILNCCYTHKDVVNPAEPSTKSRINFNLRLCFEPRPDVQEPISKEDLVASVHYTPLELQNESADFVQSLGFLGDNFTFERDQLALFSRTLHDYVSGEGDDSKSDENSASDDSVQIVE